MFGTNSQRNLGDGQQVVAVGAAQHHVVAQRVDEAQAVRHVAQLHVQLLVKPAPVGCFAADRQTAICTHREHQIRALHVLARRDLRIKSHLQNHLLHGV